MSAAVPGWYLHTPLLYRLHGFAEGDSLSSLQPQPQCLPTPMFADRYVHCACLVAAYRHVCHVDTCIDIVVHHSRDLAKADKGLRFLPSTQLQCLPIGLCIAPAL